jgi:hypothetical protein
MKASLPPPAGTTAAERLAQENVPFNRHLKWKESQLQ